MSNFDKWDQEFRKQNLFAFNHKPDGILWLKVRAVSRKQLIEPFASMIKLSLSSSKVDGQAREMYAWLLCHPEAVTYLDDFLKNRNNEFYRAKGVDEEQLKQDLQRITTYEWGGDQNNNLDKYLIGRFVKPISSYDRLCSKRDEIQQNSWNFIQTSWYNNWTSYLIESQFKKHTRVLSAVGETKSVDFFIGDIPFDLKVTYFPKEYLDSKIKDTLGNKSLAWLSKQARKHKIVVNKDYPDNEKLRILRERLSLVKPDIVKQLDQTSRKLINEAQKDPSELIKWLYEKQSARLFGAENRIFMILVDMTDMEQSWKMKRAFDLISPSVQRYLDNFNEQQLHQVQFTFGGQSYQSLANTIFVVKS